MRATSPPDDTGAALRLGIGLVALCAFPVFGCVHLWLRLPDSAYVFGACSTVAIFVLALVHADKR